MTLAFLKSKSHIFWKLWLSLGYLTPPQVTFRFGIFGKFVHRSDVPFSLHHSRRYMMLCLTLMMLASRHISTMCLLLYCEWERPNVLISFALARCWCSAWPWNLFVEDTEKPSAWVLDWLHGTNLFHLYPGTWSCLGLFIMQKRVLLCLSHCTLWILLQSC